MKSPMVWGLGCWLALTGALAVACTDESNVTPIGAAGEAGQDTGGQGGSGGKGGTPSIGGEAGQAGEAGQGGAGDCHSGLRVVKQVETNVQDIVSWPEQRAFGVNDGYSITIYKLGDDGTVMQTMVIKPADFGAKDWAFTSVAAYGTGLVAVIDDYSPNHQQKLVNWGIDGKTQTLLDGPAPFMIIGAAVEGVGVAVSAGTRERAVYVAKLENDKWSWGEAMTDEGRRLSALAIEDGHLLVAVGELARFEQLGVGGAGGTGGEGGADSESGQARIEYWTLDGVREQSHPAFGNPGATLKVAEHSWLIGETNSFWGSYNAGIEHFDTSAAPVKLTDVPVISAGDGNDGALDLARLGNRLLDANCESGLLTAPWSTTSLKLSKAPGPWGNPEDAGLGICLVDQVEVVDGVVALAGNGKLMFARECD